jgi:hypothetical protein
VTTPYAPARYVAAPAVTPPRFGLFSVSTIIDVTDPHELAGLMYEPVSCDPASITGAYCNDGSVFGTPKQTGEGVELVEGTPFAVYGRFACSPVGHWDDAQDRATANLLAGEERAIERAIHRGEAGNTMTFQGATDVTPVPGTAVSIVAGVALLESFLAANYGGIGVIHANPREATFMANEYLLADTPNNASGALTTNLGTLVASEGGMDGDIGPTGAAAAGDDHWLFATGRPTIRRSGVILTPPNRNSGLNISNNNLEMLAERMVIVTWDCVTAAVLVNTI